MGNLCSSGAKPDKKSDEPVRQTTPTKQNGLQEETHTHQALKHLGGGTSADTWIFSSREMRKPVAMKLFTRPLIGLNPEAIKDEIKAQAEVGPGHVNLINVYTLFLQEDVLGLVMELAEGGSIVNWLQSRQPLPSGLLMPEDEANFIFRQLVSAVAYIHQHGMAHRDLKLDNTLLAGKEDPPTIKICDFGFARHVVGPAAMCSDQAGTVEYMSPELLHKSIGGKDDAYDAIGADIWALGIILLVLLCGQFPYDSSAFQGDAHAQEKLWQMQISESWKKTKGIAPSVSQFSSELVDLLDKILVVRPEERISAEDIKKHPWLQHPLSEKYATALKKIQKKEKDIENYVARQKFDKAKMEARNKKIDQMVNVATTEGKGEKTNGRNVRQGTKINLGKHIEQIDLSTQAIESGSLRTDSEAQIVRDRFNRVSVPRAVQAAFENADGSKELHNAASYRPSR